MSSSAQLANAVQGARAVAAQGDVRGAFALLDQALDAATGTLGGDDPDVLAATCVLAKFHTDLGELGDARRLLEEGLAAGYHRLGDGHAVMLALSYELARIADELGNVYEAKRRYGQLTRLGPAALGEDHPSVRAARRYLGLPEPGGAFHVPHQSAPAPFEPLSAPTGTTTPPATAVQAAAPDGPAGAATWPVEQRAAPVFRPEPRNEAWSEPRDEVRPEPRDEVRPEPRDEVRPAQREKPWPAQRDEMRPAQPAPAPLWRHDEHDDWDEPVSPPAPHRPDAPAGAGWRQVDPGVLQRPDTPPWPSPAPDEPTSGGAFPTSGGAYPTSGGAHPTSGAPPTSGGAPVSGGAYPAGGALVQERAPWTLDQATPPLPHGDAPRRRSPFIALLVILVVAVLGGVTAAVVSYVAARPDRPAAERSEPPPASAAPSRTGAGQAGASGAAGDPKAPGSLRLRDDKTSITLTWTDPSKGSVPFIVAGGQQGALRQLQVLAAGATTYTLNGLNPKLDYCFTVAAVYGTDSVALSDLACTQRK
ncbi:fibronectin type III domain-containing protein [Dactylosporangium sp. NPDC050688]|uniref:fibronectin type III domain-containing protein n=1 Tax=Dactylosporangium sp. NPDC050688 TaxID=3157217 RepID=UPI0033F870A9